MDIYTNFPVRKMENIKREKKKKKNYFINSHIIKITNRSDGVLFLSFACKCQLYHKNDISNKHYPTHYMK